MTDKKAEVLFGLIKELQENLSKQNDKREENILNISKQIERLSERSENTNQNIASISEQISSYNGKITSAVEKSSNRTMEQINILKDETVLRRKACEEHFKKLDEATNPSFKTVAANRAKTTGMLIAASGLLLGFIQLIINLFKFLLNWLKG
jgi:uncharacterized coiled-coil DUF342 family protein